MFIADNIIILNQYNSFIHEKSCFKISAVVFLTLKDKQYFFKVDVTNSVDFTTADLIKKSIETSVNISLNDNSIMTVSDLIIHKLLEFK